MGLLDDLDLGGAAGAVGDEAEELDIFGALSSFMPLISDMLSEGIRRVTVTVTWEQGARSPEFVLSQHIVHPTEGSLGLMNAALLSSQAEQAQQTSQPGAAPPASQGGI